MATAEEILRKYNVSTNTNANDILKKYNISQQPQQKIQTQQQDLTGTPLGWIKEEMPGAYRVSNILAQGMTKGVAGIGDMIDVIPEVAVNAAKLAASPFLKGSPNYVPFDYGNVARELNTENFVELKGFGEHAIEFAGGLITGSSVAPTGVNLFDDLFGLGLKAVGGTKAGQSITKVLGKPFRAIKSKIDDIASPEILKKSIDEDMLLQEQKLYELKGKIADLESSSKKLTHKQQLALDSAKAEKIALEEFKAPVQADIDSIKSIENIQKGKIATAKQDLVEQIKTITKQTKSASEFGMKESTDIVVELEKNIR